MRQLEGALEHHSFVYGSDKRERLYRNQLKPSHTMPWATGRPLGIHSLLVDGVHRGYAHSKTWTL